MSRRRHTAFGLLITTILVLGFLAHTYPRFPGDLPVSLVVQSLHSPSFLAVMKGISYIFDHLRGMVVVLVTALIFWRTAGLFEGGIVLLSGLFTSVNEIFKLLVNRPRPPSDLVHLYIVETETSFPSGHAVFAVAVLGIIAYLIASRQHRTSEKTLTVLLFGGLVLAVGFSRVYLGAHWVSDVAGGYLVGILFLFLEIWILQSLRTAFPPKPREKLYNRA